MIDFSDLDDGTVANGLIVDDVLFQVTKTASFSDGIVIDGGPKQRPRLT